MDYIKMLGLLAQFDMEEIKTLMEAVKKIVNTIKLLQKPGNTRAEVVTLLRDMSIAFEAAADVADPTT